MKFPFRPITKPQIKKIIFMKNMYEFSDKEFELLLSQKDVKSVAELNRQDAKDLIDNLMVQFFYKKVEENRRDRLTGISDKRLVYFNRFGKATNQQLEYLSYLWVEVSKTTSYEGVMHFIKEVTGELYIHVESISTEDMDEVIQKLKIIKKQKELR